MCELQGKSGLSLESAESSTQCWDGMSTQFSVLNWTSFLQQDPEEILPDNILLGHLFELIYIGVNWEDDEKSSGGFIVVYISCISHVHCEYVYCFNCL